jgi:L-methionine (R)-S-oxide reductase
MMRLGCLRRQNGFQSMGYDPDFLTRLLGASRLLEQGQDLEQGLRKLAGMTARLLGTQKCSIMLLSASDEEEQPLLRVFAHYGDLPAEAYREVTRFNQGIAGHVLATEASLLIADIADSPFAEAGRRGRDEPHRSLISAPIPLGDRTIGVINVDNPLNGRSFTEEDLRLVNLFALFVGKSIHVVQLQNVLRSALVQYAIARDERETGAEPPGTRLISHRIQTPATPTIAIPISITTHKAATTMSPRVTPIAGHLESSSATFAIFQSSFFGLSGHDISSS